MSKENQFKVVEDECESDGREAVVVLQGEKLEDVTSTQAVSAALEKAAAMGVVRPGLNSQSGPYPVDEHGVTDDDLALGQRSGVVAYRQDFKLVSAQY